MHSNHTCAPPRGMQRRRPRALPRGILLAFALSLAALPSARAQEPAGKDEAPENHGLHCFAELSAGPILGLDAPLRGGTAGGAIGARLSPFEAGIRAAEAYDAALKCWDTRLDFELGLGSGLRAIIGGLLLPCGISLSDSSGQTASVAATAADWPNRFGIGATIAELFRIEGIKGGGPAIGLDAGIVYTSYRLEARNALTGAAAFAASVEASIALRFRWGGERGHP